MEHTFWHNKWQSNDIAFHEGDVNPLLVKYLGKLALPVGARIFVPLCGKTRDIAWLLSQGFRVVGAELSPLAIEQLFDELRMVPDKTSMGELTHCHAANIDVFIGDIFALATDQIGAVDAVYDRAALVALPAELRQRYAQHLLTLTRKAPQLLICYDYDQQVMPGPPFSVNADEIRTHYAATHTTSLVSSEPLAGGLKGKCQAQENVWILRPL